LPSFLCNYGVNIQAEIISDLQVDGVQETSLGKVEAFSHMPRNNVNMYGLFRQI
jgi:hypothetical protein